MIKWFINIALKYTKNGGGVVVVICNLGKEAEIEYLASSFTILTWFDKSAQTADWMLGFFESQERTSSSFFLIFQK